MSLYVGGKCCEGWRRLREVAGDEGAAPIRGFMCVIGGFLVQLTLGSYYSFANMMPYMVSYMRLNSSEKLDLDKNPNATSDDGLTYSDFIVVQSAWGITQGCVLPVAGALVAYIGVCKAVMLGSLLFAVAPAVTSFAIETTLFNVILSFGVLSSIGQNIAILPTLTLPMAWFPHRRGLIAGIVVSGFGMGAFFFNQLQTRIINPSNLMVSRDGTSNDGYFVQDEILQKVPLLLQILAAVYAGLLLVGGMMLLQHAPASRQCRLGVEQMCERVVIVAAGPMGERGDIISRNRNKKKKKKKTCGKAEPPQQNETTEEEDTSLKGKLRSACGPDSNLALVLRYPETYLLWLTRFGVVLVSQGLSGLYKAFALGELGYHDDFLAHVGAIAGIFNCLGRITFGVLVDKINYKILMYAECLVMMGLIAPFYWISELNKWAFASALWACYFCISGTFAMHPALCGRIYGPFLQFVAIGLVGSSDIVNNLLIGLLSSEILRLVDWAGYFICLSSLCLLVVIVTAVFPKKNIKIQSLKEYQKERAAKVAAEKAALEAAAAAANSSSNNPGSRRNSKLRDMLNGLHLKSKTDIGSGARQP